MSKNRPIKVGFCALVLAFLLGMNAWALAQEEGMCVFPTGPGQVTYPENWQSSALEVHTSGVTISSDNPVDLWVVSNGQGCPPYQWSVTGAGYSFSDSTTASDLEITTLTSAAGTCGFDYSAYTTVTVTDACLATDTAYIRNNGKYVRIEEIDDCVLGASLDLSCRGRWIYQDNYKAWYLDWPCFKNATASRWTKGYPYPCDYYNDLPADNPPPCGSPQDCGYPLTANYYEWTCQ